MIIKAQKCGIICQGSGGSMWMVTADGAQLNPFITYDRGTKQWEVLYYGIKAKYEKYFDNRKAAVSYVVEIAAEESK